MKNQFFICVPEFISLLQLRKHTHRVDNVFFLLTQWLLLNRIYLKWKLKLLLLLLRWMHFNWDEWLFNSLHNACVISHLHIHSLTHSTHVNKSLIEIKLQGVNVKCMCTTWCFLVDVFFYFAGKINCWTCVFDMKSVLYRNAFQNRLLQIDYA